MAHSHHYCFCGSFLRVVIQHLQPFPGCNIKGKWKFHINLPKQVTRAADANTPIQELKVSASQVSLTITSYLIMQAVTPLLWGPMSDTLGRRPTYIASMGVYIGANVALSFSPNYAVLLIFRGLQAAGSASTVSIGGYSGLSHLFSSQTWQLMGVAGNGVIQDISPTAERGAYISFYQASESQFSPSGF